MALAVGLAVSFHKVPEMTPSPALSRKMYWFGPTVLPVRSPVVLPSTPTLSPPQLVKSSGRLLQVSVALLLATMLELGRSTE
ncbi:hypothetical protein D3C84_1165520 [compost metagenome]